MIPFRDYFCSFKGNDRIVAKNLALSQRTYNLYDYIRMGNIHVTTTIIVAIQFFKTIEPEDANRSSTFSVPFLQSPENKTRTSRMCFTFHSFSLFHPLPHFYYFSETFTKIKISFKPW
jgi:hypothetical protein